MPAQAGMAGTVKKYSAVKTVIKIIPIALIDIRFHIPFMI